MDADVLEARPQRTARWANVSAVVALIVFVVIAFVMKTANAGAHFGDKDQVFTVVVGVLVAGALRLPARPRMRADADAVYLRSYLGNWRTVPWTVIVGVEFPTNVRFLQLLLPGDERLAVYAVQRIDRDYAVGKTRALRRMFAQTHPVG